MPWAFNYGKWLRQEAQGTFLRKYYLSLVVKNDQKLNEGPGCSLSNEENIWTGPLEIRKPCQGGWSTDTEASSIFCDKEVFALEYLVWMWMGE